MNVEVDMVRVKDDQVSRELVTHIGEEDWTVEGDWIVMTLDEFSYIADLKGLDYDEALTKFRGQEFYRTVAF